jgi:hypothetical protein
MEPPSALPNQCASSRSSAAGNTATSSQSDGGLSKATQRKLTALTRELQKNGSITPDPGLHPRPGSRLVREWRGRTHTVVVTDNGFEHAGKTYSSLSKIAQVITGAHWSGPRFFGLNRHSTLGVVQSESIASDAIGE